MCGTVFKMSLEQFQNSMTSSDWSAHWVVHLVSAVFADLLQNINFVSFTYYVCLLSYLSFFFAFSYFALSIL